MKAQCQHCRYWMRDKSYRTSRVGDCRRFPPQVIAQNGMRITYFPEVFNSEWCGEFKPREGK